MAATATGPVVLYVEDNHLDVMLVRQAFIEAKVAGTLHVVENAVQAFSFLVKQPPFQDAPDVDLVLLDLNLPVIDGVRALTIIKTSIDLKAKKVAVFTSSERSADRATCLRLGAAAYESKPSSYEGYVALAHRLSGVLSDGCPPQPATTR